MDKVDLYWIKLKTTNNDSYGPIYVYINIETISSISRFKDVTNIYLTNGEHYTVEETPTAIIDEIEKITTLDLATTLADMLR